MSITLCGNHYWKAGRTTHIQVIGQGHTGHLPKAGVLAADAILLFLQEVLPEAHAPSSAFLRGLPLYIGILRRGEELSDEVEASPQGHPASEEPRLWAP